MPGIAALRKEDADSDPPFTEGGLVVFRWFGATPPPTLSLPEQIAARLGDRIVTGAIAPGAHIVEQEIANEFRASRGPVREALRILEREGLAQIHPRRGARASQLSRQDVFDLFEIRAHLYQAVASRLAEQQRPDAVWMLETGIRDLRRLAELPDDAGRYAETVFRLSLNCARAAGNRRLADLITSLALQTYRYSRLALRTRARRRQSLALWQDSLEAIRDGDVATAVVVAGRRILAARAEALRLLPAEPAGADPPPR
jgi:DNA-binding GntR family transcriptional regulator